MFGITEHCGLPEPDDGEASNSARRAAEASRSARRAAEASRSARRAAAARRRLACWLTEATAGRNAAAVVLTAPGPVAWVTGGAGAPVDRTAAADVVWAVVTRDTAALITTEVEADRIRAEYGPDRHGFAELVAVPWYEPEAFIRVAEELSGSPAPRIAADGHPAFGIDAAADLAALRLALSPPEQEDLRELGMTAAAAIEGALAAWRPGQRDLDIQAECASRLEAAGADAPVLIVGGDERVRRYRHPLACGEPVLRLAMAVVVARRGGLHAAATRFATAGQPDEEFTALRGRVLGIERRVLGACVPGRAYADALAALDEGYRDAGAPGGWAGHYQGGPVGFAQREFEIAPGQADSVWYSAQIRLGQAVAWNPSLPGGAKAEDTYLLTPGGPGEAGGPGGPYALERLTISSGWPAEPADLAGPGDLRTPDEPAGRARGGPAPPLRQPRPAVLRIG
jgi:Xaa-Pro dipeptidase